MKVVANGGLVIPPANNRVAFDVSTAAGPMGVECTEQWKKEKHEAL